MVGAHREKVTGDEKTVLLEVSERLVPEVKKTSRQDHPGSSWGHSRGSGRGFPRMQLIEREELTPIEEVFLPFLLRAKDRVAAGDLVKSTYDGWRRYVRVLFSDNKDCFVERLRVIDVMEWLTSKPSWGPTSRKHAAGPSAEHSTGHWNLGDQIQSLAMMRQERSPAASSSSIENCTVGW